MTNYFQPLVVAFETNSNVNDALQMKQYMQGLFSYYGIKSQARRAICKGFFAKYGYPTPDELPAMLTYLWKQPQREFQMLAVDLAIKGVKKQPPEFIEIIEKLITTKSWWDTVDMLVVNVAGVIFKANKEFERLYPEKWIQSDNLWLQRSALLYQLKYKSATDTERLFSYIQQLSGFKEFFIRKAIGWTLREYTKTDSELVKTFVASNDLGPLSNREALKWLNAQKQSS